MEDKIWMGSGDERSEVWLAGRQSGETCPPGTREKGNEQFHRSAANLRIHSIILSIGQFLTS